MYVSAGGNRFPPACFLRGWEKEVFRGCLKRTRMTRITRIYADVTFNMYLIVNKIKILEHPRYPRHPRSNRLLRQPQLIFIFLFPKKNLHLCGCKI